MAGNDRGTVRVRDAATVMLVRDAPRLEVFMLRRSARSEFVGGAYVFPGGAVDDADRAADLEPLCAARTDAEASVTLGVDRGGLAFWVAAVRECFEEAGVLLARRLDSGEVVGFADADVERRFDDHRQSVHSGSRHFVDVVRDEGLVLDVGSIHYFSHWITPVGAPRRYDTRFFVAAAPRGQRPLPDHRETVAALWVEPADALARAEAGELALIFPTVRTLMALTRFERSFDLLEAARVAGDLPAFEPRVVDDAHGERIVLPGDEAYEAAVRHAEGSPPIEPVVPSSAGWKGTDE